MMRDGAMAPSSHGRSSAAFVGRDTMTRVCNANGGNEHGRRRVDGIIDEGQRTFVPRFGFARQRHFGYDGAA